MLFSYMGAPFSKLAERQQFWNERKGKDLLIFKQGALTKQSKYLKHWRQRTIILVEKYIVTFDDVQLQHPPTAIIPIHRLSALAKEEQLQFFLVKVITKSREEYRFRTENAKERDEWFQKIKQEKIRYLKNSNVTLSIVQDGDKRMTSFVEDEQLETCA